MRWQVSLSTAYVSATGMGRLDPWPAHLYEDQINPQVTGANGYFAFFNRRLYYLEARGTEGFQAWRSPVVQVVNEIVHVNVPLTPFADASVVPVTLLADGPSRDGDVGGRWCGAVAPDTSALTTEMLTQQSENPRSHPLSVRNPLSDTTGFDGGMLAPGRTYVRQFAVPGTYAYTDGLGHTGTVVVTSRVFLPLVLRQ